VRRRATGARGRGGDEPAPTGRRSSRGKLINAPAAALARSRRRIGLAGEALQAAAVHVQQRAIQVALVAQVVGAALQRFAREDLSQHARSPG
jgi:hypothetical protein